MMSSLPNSNIDPGPGDTYNGSFHNGSVGGHGNTNIFINDYKVPPGSKGFDKLLARIAPNALHNSGEVSDQPKCHPGTRVAILEHLIDWARLLTPPYLIKWLHGPAGAGKSSILRTIAQMLSNEGLLLASFFFFRTSDRRNTSDFVIATIAYQLTLCIPETRQHIGEAVERNPIIFTHSLRDQALTLVISPLVAIFYDPKFDSRRYPRVIIIDGLDECQDPEKQRKLMDVLHFIVQSVPMSLSVLVASRPEHHIRGAFDMGDLNKSSSRLSLDDSYEPDSDIRKYLIDKFGIIRQIHPRAFASDMEWPSPKAIDCLVTKASGQFIYVSTVVNFVSSRSNPIKRLEIVLSGISAGGQRPFEQLDNLYSTIFQTIDKDYVASALRVLGFLLIPPLDLPKHPDDYESRSPAYLEYFLELQGGDVREFLFDLESLLTLSSNWKNIRFFHASLSDYLFDKSRSGQFWIDSGLIYPDITQHCISHLLSWRDVGTFFVKYSRFLSSNAGSTPELQKAIENCDFDKVIATFSENGVHGIRDICPSILQIAIDESRFPNGPQLFAHKIDRFRQVVSEITQVYFTNIYLKSCLVTATLVHTPKGAPFVGHVDDLAKLLLSSADRRVEQEKGLNLLESKDTPSVMVFVKPFLDNPFIDDVEYTNITLFLLQCTFRPDKIKKRHSFNPVVRTYVMNHISTYLFSKSLIRSDLVDETKAIISKPQRNVYQGYPELWRSMEDYISRADVPPAASKRHKIAQAMQAGYQTIKGSFGLK